MTCGLYVFVRCSVSAGGLRRCLGKKVAVFGTICPRWALVGNCAPDNQQWENADIRPRTVPMNKTVQFRLLPRRPLSRDAHVEKSAARYAAECLAFAQIRNKLKGSSIS